MYNVIHHAGLVQASLPLLLIPKTVQYDKGEYVQCNTIPRIVELGTWGAGENTSAPSTFQIIKSW